MLPPAIVSECQTYLVASYLQKSIVGNSLVCPILVLGSNQLSFSLGPAASPPSAHLVSFGVHFVVYLGPHGPPHLSLDPVSPSSAFGAPRLAL